VPSVTVLKRPVRLPDSRTTGSNSSRTAPSISNLFWQQYVSGSVIGGVDQRDGGDHPWPDHLHAIAYDMDPAKDGRQRVVASIENTLIVKISVDFLDSKHYHISPSLKLRYFCR